MVNLHSAFVPCLYIQGIIKSNVFAFLIFFSWSYAWITKTRFGKKSKYITATFVLVANDIKINVDSSDKVY